MLDNMANCPHFNEAKYFVIVIINNMMFLIINDDSSITNPTNSRTTRNVLTMLMLPRPARSHLIPSSYHLQPVQILQYSSICPSAVPGRGSSSTVY